MAEGESKHIQTKLPADEYEMFREFAENRGLTVKEASREALVQWIEQQQRVDPNDQAFTVLDDLDEDSLPSSAETNASQEDDQVTAWSGGDITFRLADDPSAQH